jgi:transposase InsO family protein
MDFKGREKLACGGVCHPLTVVDDHSRYALALEACADQRLPTVRERLIPVFRRHGLPRAVYVDNGTPWGAGRPGQWTRLTEPRRVSRRLFCLSHAAIGRA